jgi:Ca2+-binding RTX toxin-like protein
VTAGDVTGDGRPEIIGAWNNIWYWDVADSGYTKIDTVSPPTGDIAAGDFTGDGIADVAAIYDSGLWYVDGASSTWKEVTRRVPFRLTAGDIKATVTANAGEDQTVQVESADATLDGGASTPEGGTFAWSFDSKPPGSDAVIIRRNEQIAFFEADLEGDYIVELTYTVGEESDTDTMVVTAGPKITARAGELQTVDVGDLVTLDGSGSTPVGGTFLWFLEKPPESNAELTGHNTATPTFTPDVVGHYEGILKYFVGEFFGVDFVDIHAEPILP